MTQSGILSETFVRTLHITKMQVSHNEIENIFQTGSEKQFKVLQCFITEFEKLE